MASVTPTTTALPASATRRVWLRLVGLPMLLLLLLLAMRPVAPHQTVTITMGQEAGLNPQGQGEHLYNFFGWGNVGTELGRAARRIDPTASFMVPYAFRMGQPLLVTVTMCGCGPAEPVQFSLNGTPYILALTDDWQAYTFTVATPAPMYAEALYLEWHSDAALRPLVHQVTVHAQQPHGITGALLASGALLAVLWLMRAAPVRQQLLWAGVVLFSALLSRWLYAPQLLTWAMLIGLGGAAAIALTVLARPLAHRLILWAVVLWLLALPQLLGTWVLDDAFISLRYARNLIEGFGFTFNPGGERVEGYTNFLWTMIMAGVLALGWEPVVAAQVLTSALAITAVLLSYRFAVAWWGPCPFVLLPPVLLAINPAFLLYSARGSGMETALVMMLGTAALWLIWRAQDGRGGVLAGGMCALVVMTRPDGALIPLAGGLILLAQVLAPRSRRPALPILFGLVGGFALIYAPYYLWRFSYYGYPLPNTFYAKTGATTAQVLRGVDYSYTFFASLGLRSVLVLLGFSALGMLVAAGQAVRATPSGHPPVRLSPAPLLWLFVLLSVTYVTLVGGDQFPLARFFVPLLPALLLLLTHGVVQAHTLGQVVAAQWDQRVRWLGYAPLAGATLAVILLAYVNITPLPSLDSRDPSGRIWGENRVTLKNRELGWWFRFNTAPDTVVATAIAGAMPFYGDRYTIDTLGLNDTHIAHLEIETMGQGIAGAEKTDLEYVLNQQPDYIPFSTSGPYQELPRFQQEYELLTVRGPEGGEILLFRRRDREASLRP
ncbi:MAG: hypothetical protein HC911_09445 [Chloroflexaceae bacterium]|nr:hypothetical protein [Chloroflexaceae bacterium]